MKNFSVVFLILLSAQILIAKNQTNGLVMPRIMYTGDINCNIPPPSILNIESIGSDWVQVSWTPVMGASQYRLQAFDVDSGSEIGTPVFVAGWLNTGLVNTIGNNGSAYVRIWSVCDNGSFNVENFTQSENFDTIIIDVVATGFDAPSYFSTQVVGVGPANGVNVPWGGENETFSITFTRNGFSFLRRFGLEIDPSGNPDYVDFKMGEQANNGQHIVLLKEFNSTGVCTGMLVKYRTDLTIDPAQGILIATIRINQVLASGQGKVYRLSPDSPFCVIERLVPNSIGLREVSNPVAERSTAIFSLCQTAVAPNPFTSMLNIQLPVTNDPTETEVYLYDLRGMQRITCQVPAKQTEYNINTEQLEPGMYFMRIESGGKIENIKLMKTQ